MALSSVGKAAYAAAFVLVLPTALAVWARATEGLVTLPAVHAPGLGWAIAGAGLLLMLAGMRDLWVHGGGLPMNAAPPPRYVTRGSYAVLPHPIYTGFCAGCVGVAVATGSASGLWMVLPLAVLGCAALVLGYEHHDLRERFAEQTESAWSRGGARRWMMRGLAAVVVALVVELALALVAPAEILRRREVQGVVAAEALLAGWMAGALWEGTRRVAERVANSWREWRWGRVRVIGHGFYAGAGGFVAIWLAGVLAGPGHIGAILFAALCAVVGAALWAQWVEGSAVLLRPYGFFGGLIGGTLGAMAAPLFGTSTWMVLAVFSATGAWAQGMGRMRCLVQGCCHGRPSSEAVGIRYRHPRSRVVRLTEWSDVALHPTPLYSILWNALVGLLLVRLWLGHAALALIIGLYFVLGGIGRFAEEAWRGEPQTKVVWGLRVYQWAAVASVVAGAVFMVIADRSAAPTPEFRWGAVGPAVVFGLVVTAAMGVDLPESNRRFSRLT